MKTTVVIVYDTKTSAWSTGQSSLLLEQVFKLVLFISIIFVSVSVCVELYMCLLACLCLLCCVCVPACVCVCFLAGAEPVLDGHARSKRVRPQVLCAETARALR